MSLEVGDLVILTNEITPPAKWPVGRVIKANPAPDGVVRVVTIKTPSTTLERPVSKTIFLIRPSTDLTDESGRNVQNPQCSAITTALNTCAGRLLSATRCCCCRKESVSSITQSWIDAI